MDVQVYTEVRGANVFPEKELRKALHSYSPDFEYREARENDHQYRLFEPLPPCLIIVNFFPKGHPYLEPNVIATFTSNSRELSREVAERFEKSAGLELLTEHECKRLGEFPNTFEKVAFEEAMAEQAANN